MRLAFAAERVLQGPPRATPPRAPHPWPPYPEHPPRAPRPGPPRPPQLCLVVTPLPAPGWEAGCAGTALPPRDRDVQGSRAADTGAGIGLGGQVHGRWQRPGSIAFQGTHSGWQRPRRPQVQPRARCPPGCGVTVWPGAPPGSPLRPRSASGGCRFTLCGGSFPRERLGGQVDTFRPLLTQLEQLNLPLGIPAPTSQTPCSPPSPRPPLPELPMGSERPG